MTTLRPPLLGIVLISAAALGYEVLLTRIFAVVHWHHLVATTISLALLGYGVSGTFLALAGDRLRQVFRPAFVANALLFAVSGAGCVLLAERLSFDPLALRWDWAPLVDLAVIYLLLAIPFLAAANCIGLALWRFPEQIPRLYGLDLLGAGVGVAALLLVVSLLPLGNALLAIALGGVLAAAFAALTFRWRGLAALLIAAAAATAYALWDRVEIRSSTYKDLARAQTVLGAEVERERFGITGRVTVLRNDRVPLRSAPGLSLTARELPPEQLAVFVDGEARGTLLLDPPGETPAFLYDLTSALPYALLTEPRVLILGAGSGLAVRQARAHGAREVVAVEPNPLLVELACDPAAPWSAKLCRDPVVSWHAFNTRAFVAERRADFDLILLGAETDPAGLNSQHEDFALTTEALTEYLSHLSPRGLLAIDGGTRLPPRLALRLAATAQAALERRGVERPGEHLAVIRGWQRFNLLVARQPLGAEHRRAVRDFARQRGFDLVWLSDLEPDETNRYQRLAEPLFADGVRALLTPTADPPAVLARYRLEPAIDDRPFPFRFSRGAELLDRFTAERGGRAAGPDLGLLLAVITLACAVVASLVLILLPLAFRRRDAIGEGQRHWRWRTVLYFGLIGLAFLFIEIAWIHRLQRFLGQPIYATAFVLAVFLVFAGLGSSWFQHRAAAPGRPVLIAAVAAIALLSILYLVQLDPWLDRLHALPLPGRGLVVVAVLAPLAFAMGIPFPLGLHWLGRDAEPLVPWAWGINGCASVISAVATPLLAMEIGFSGVVLLAIGAYLALVAIVPHQRARPSPAPAPH